VKLYVRKPGGSFVQFHDGVLGEAFDVKVGEAMADGTNIAIVVVDPAEVGVPSLRYLKLRDIRDGNPG